MALKLVLLVEFDGAHVGRQDVEVHGFDEGSRAGGEGGEEVIEKG